MSSAPLPSTPAPPTPAPAPAARAPRAHLPRDPRFRGVLARSLRKFGMEDYFGAAVTKLVTGETDPRTMVCCNTGCHPCARDYLGAAEFVLRELAKRRRRFFFF